MANQPIALPWDAPDWLEKASAWIHTRLAQEGLQAIQPLEVLHQRAWSTFIKITTDRGLVYFKAPAPYDTFEAALTEAMGRWRPDITASILAVDLDLGWLLTADAGQTLRELDRSPAQIDHWLKILPLYADLQMEMTQRVPAILALGVPDRRLARLPGLFNELLESENLRLGQDPGLTPEEYQRLLHLKPRFAAECAHLASYNLPETLTHEEVTEVNILFGMGRYVFTDWSEASLCHPFFTTLTTTRTLVYWLGLEESGQELTRVRDAYLEPWTKYETRSKINSAHALAFRLAMANRAIGWDLDTGQLAPRHKEPYVDSVPGWLQDYLEANS